MTTAVDICNRALSEIGTQKSITSLSDNTPQAKACLLWYDELRQQLLHAAHWGFARGQASLALVGDFDPDLTSPYPWQWKYTYPAAALRMRYLLRQAPTVDRTVIPFGGIGYGSGMRPSRQNRYIVSSDLNGGTYSKVLLTNVPNAIGVYTVGDITNPDLFDAGFRSALIAMLAYKLVIPLSGNAGMRTEFKQTALQTILAAQAQDANEAIPTTDHTPDWIATRGIAPYGPYGVGADCSWGNWTDGYGELSWGM